MTTVHELITQGEHLFTEQGLYFGHGTDNAWDEAVHIVCFVIGASPEADRKLLNRVVSAADEVRIRNLYRRRVGERIPVPYLTGTAWFCRMPFKVNPRVIIPRSPIGELVGGRFEPWLELPPRRILDLCCGSGCIGIAIAHAFPDAEVVLSDISPAAIALTRENIDAHNLGGRVTTVVSDGFAGLANQVFDLIVCNPPYVDAEDMASMPPEFSHEPALALSSGDDGLDFTRMLLANAADCLTEEGLLFGEVGNSWESLEKAFPYVDFEWIEFANGGHGVYCLSQAQLRDLR